ncbi:hypothetical protein [Lactococcus ileimucosae]|uniref:hypothetical protein n=1 Tax=Lactococcus ileimucosae TaxID=2941329 RepID=UPI0035142265
MKKILIFFITFWLPSAVVLIMSLGSSSSVVDNQDIPVLSFSTIFFKNLLVLTLLIVGGLIHRKITYFIFYYNAIYFSIVLVISHDVMNSLYQVGKYGIIEIFAFSLGCFIGIDKKYKLIWIPVVLLIISGIIEHFVIKGAL